MDDNNISQDFLNNIIGLADPRVRNAILGFVNNLSVLLAVMNQDIENLMEAAWPPRVTHSVAIAM